MIRVEIYSKSDCPLCDEAKAVLLEVRRDVEFELVEVDITLDPALFERYRCDIPVVFVNAKKAFKHRLEARAGRERLAREK